MELGTKFDTEKPDWTLLPIAELEDVVRVLMLGAKKYSPDNWKFVLPKERYYAACLRHLVAWKAGEKFDSETHITHIAHALCCLLFLSWHDKQEVKT